MCFSDMISFILQCLVEVKYGDMFSVLCLCASAVYKAQVLEGNLLLNYLCIIGLWHACAFGASLMLCVIGIHASFFFKICFASIPSLVRPCGCAHV